MRRKCARRLHDAGPPRRSGLDSVRSAHGARKQLSIKVLHSDVYLPSFLPSLAPPPRPTTPSSIFRCHSPRVILFLQLPEPPLPAPPQPRRLPRHSAKYVQSRRRRIPTPLAGSRLGWKLSEKKEKKSKSSGPEMSLKQVFPRRRCCRRRRCFSRSCRRAAHFFASTEPAVYGTCGTEGGGG